MTALERPKAAQRRGDALKKGTDIPLVPRDTNGGTGRTSELVAEAIGMKQRTYATWPQQADADAPGWEQHAACRGSGVEFVDVDAEHGEALVHRYCAHCPVVEDCRDLAAELLPVPGVGASVWGAQVFRRGEHIEAEL